MAIVDKIHPFRKKLLLAPRVLFAAISLHVPSFLRQIRSGRAEAPKVTKNLYTVVLDAQLTKSLR